MQVCENGIRFQNAVPATEVTRRQQRTLDSLRLSEDVIRVVERQEV